MPKWRTFSSINTYGSPTRFTGKRDSVIVKQEILGKIGLLRLFKSDVKPQQEDTNNMMK
ncbi:MAG: hypothetical protein AAF349_25030 [Cyanobacteria bacterium P01_A01_bin.68]